MDVDIMDGDEVVVIDKMAEYRKKLYLTDVDPKRFIVVEDIVVDDAYRKLYPDLTDMELKKFLAQFNGSYRSLAYSAEVLNRHRESEKCHGVMALQPQPLFHVSSVSVESNDEILAVHGEIHAQFWYRDKLYARQFWYRNKAAPQFIGTNAVLTLNAQDFESDDSLDYACLPFMQNWDSSMFVFVYLYDSKGRVFARERVELDDEFEDDGYHVVRCKYIPSRQSGAGLTLRYVVIPFGVSCGISVYVSSRKEGGVSSLDVSGSISAKYAGLEERIQLYDKPENEPQRVHQRERIQLYDEPLNERVHQRELLQLSRCWVALPAYSSLFVDMELSIVGPQDKKIKIVKGAVKLLPHVAMDTTEDKIVADDYLVTVKCFWSPPDHHWTSNPMKTKMKRQYKMKGKVSLDDDGLPHPYPSPAVEIFSVFLGREKLMAAQVYGSIEFAYHTIFKADAKEALTLEEDAKFIPVSCEFHGLFSKDEPLLMNLDIKDVEGPLAVKGYSVDRVHAHSRLLCSFFRSQHGFVALHYAVFPKAVEAYIEVDLKLKTRTPRVSGRIIAQYSCFDYTSKYDKDFYRIVLFRRGENDPAQLGADCTMSLSRSKVVVPWNSSLILNVALSFGAKKLFERIEIRLNSKHIKSSDGTLDIKVDWRMIE